MASVPEGADAPAFTLPLPGTLPQSSTLAHHVDKGKTRAHVNFVILPDVNKF